jgi:hypothetical protein
LENKWSFWYSPRGKNSNPTASKNYEAQLSHIGDCGTMGEFFSIYCYLKKPDDIIVDHKMIFFRKGHLPCWEVSPPLKAEMAQRRLLDPPGQEERRAAQVQWQVGAPPLRLHQRGVRRPKCCRTRPLGPPEEELDRNMAQERQGRERPHQDRREDQRPTRIRTDQLSVLLQRT